MPPVSMMPASRASLSGNTSIGGGLGGVGGGVAGDVSNMGGVSPTRVVTSEPKLNVSKVQTINNTERKSKLIDTIILHCKEKMDKLLCNFYNCYINYYIL